MSGLAPGVWDMAGAVAWGPRLEGPLCYATILKFFVPHS